MNERKYYRGSTWKPRLTITNLNTGLAVDLSAYTAYWALKKSTDEAAVYIIAKTLGTTDSSGHLDATILDTVTDDIPSGKYIAEWEWSIGTGSNKVVSKHQYQIEVKSRVINT